MTVETIDMTPTWNAILPILFAALEEGTAKGKAAARDELRRMATCADRWNAHAEPMIALLHVIRDARPLSIADREQATMILAKLEG